MLPGFIPCYLACDLGIEFSVLALDEGQACLDLAFQERIDPSS